MFPIPSSKRVSKKRPPNAFTKPPEIKRVCLEDLPTEHHVIIWSYLTAGERQTIAQLLRKLANFFKEARPFLKQLDQEGLYKKAQASADRLVALFDDEGITPPRQGEEKVYFSPLLSQELKKSLSLFSSELDGPFSGRRPFKKSAPQNFYGSTSLF